MCVLPVTDDSCVSQQFKDPKQLQPEKISPLSALLVLKAQTGFQFTDVPGCIFKSSNKQCQSRS